MSQPAFAKLSPAGAPDVALEPETSFIAEPSPTQPPRRSFVRTAVIVVVLAAGLFWGIRTVHRMLTHAETDDAYVTGYVHEINSHVGGTVIAALVEENSAVKTGDVLFRLDPRDHEAKVKQAEAQLAQSDALINYTEAQIDESRAKVEQAQAQFVKAKADFERAQDLAKTRVVSKQELDAARAQQDTASASLVSAKAAAVGMESGMKVAEAQRENSRASLENARLQLSYNTITSPTDGRASKRSAEIGAYVQPGQTLVAIVEPDVWVQANFKETQLAKMKVGQTAEITVDALPGKTFRGKVESFSPASGAEFAMLPADNATGNFTKVVQRVPVKIRFDPDSIRGVEDRLRAGLSVVVSVQLD